MRSIKIGKVALVYFVILFSCSLAWAQGDNATSAARAFDEGQRLFKQRNYLSAIIKFKIAYRLKPHYAVQCTIAQCNTSLGRFVEAAKHYRRCLKEGGDFSPRATEIRSKLKAAKSQIVSVDVVSPGAGGTIYVDGVVIGLTPRRVSMNPGKHVVEVRRAGAKSATITVNTQAGEKRTLSLVPGKHPPKGTVTHKPPKGTVTHKPPKATVTHKPPKATVTHKPPKHQSPKRHGISSVWFWTSAALTVALTGAAVGLGVWTYQTRSDYEGSPTKDGYDSFVRNRLITNILAGVAGAAAGGTTLLFFYTDFSGGGTERHSDLSAVSAVIGVQGIF